MFCRWLLEVVHRVVRAVRVGRRQDEDVEVVDELTRLRVDRVVAEQLLGGLETCQRRRPLAGVLLAVEEDADLRAVALLADPQHGVLNGPRCTWAFVAVLRKSDRLTFARGWTMPPPALPRYVSATTSALAAGLALIAPTTCAAVLVRRRPRRSRG